MALVVDGARTAVLVGPDGGNLLPAATALSDGLANPTTTQVGADLLLWNGNWTRATTAGSQGDANAGAYLASGGMAYNGSAWDRVYNNVQGTLLASAARTATTASPNQTNFNARGVMLFLNITAASGTGGLQPVINALDPVSGGSFQTVTSPAAATAVGKYGYLYYPGISATGGNVGSAFSSIVPRIWFVNVIHGDSSSYTYSVGFSLVN